MPMYAAARQLHGYVGTGYTETTPLAAMRPQERVGEWYASSGSWNQTGHLENELRRIGVITRIGSWIGGL